MEERTAKLGEDIIDFDKSLKRDEINSPLITQLVKSGTSIGANYMEADGADSEECKRLWQEAQELTLIFSSILLSKKNTHFDI